MAKAVSTSFQRLFRPAYKKFQNEQHRIAAMATHEPKWGGERVQHRSTAMPAEEMKWGREAVSYEERRTNLSSSTRTPTPEAVRRPERIPSPVQVSKPKARDSNKRAMTFEEKDKLREGLETLPQEKMYQAVQIVKKRDPSLTQNDDGEIEVDIEVLDKETLWELDRFVISYRKTMCKIKRQQEIEEVNQDQPMAVDGSKSPASEMTEAVTTEIAKNLIAMETGFGNNS